MSSATTSSILPEMITKPPAFGLIDRAARSAVLMKLRSLPQGSITVRDSTGEETIIGRQGADLATTIRINRPRFYRRAMTGGSLAAAATYLDGDWDCDDLTAFFRIFVRGTEEADRLDRGLSRIGLLLGRWYHAMRANTKSGSRRNIADHYDLGNDLFELFLDPTLSYSCAVFDRPGMTLEEASIAKLDRVGRKLNLTASDHLLEIGTGWGGLAIHLAGRYGCRVTTTTISREQYDLAQKRIADAGFSDRITVLLEDYRDLTGQFDKLVSIEMIEAVGHEFLPTYFGRCASLLKPGGSALIQAITMPDHRYEAYRKQTDFIQRYVFPGSCVPSMSAMSAAMKQASDFTLVDREEIGPHYATTLRTWRANFFDRVDQVRAMGYPERFIRLWNYYLCYCEAGFEERYIGTSQLLLQRP